MSDTDILATMMPSCRDGCTCAAQSMVPRVEGRSDPAHDPHGGWKRMTKRAGVPSTPHDLLHHYASVLIDGGEPVKVVQERLGHASATETLEDR